MWAFIRRETFWFVLPTLYLYYCLEWEHSVSAFRISDDLAPHSKSLTLFKIYCFHCDACAQPPSSLSHFSLPLSLSLSICLLAASHHLLLPHPHPRLLSFSLSPSPTSLSLLLQDSERKGFMNKLYAIQDVCISVQNALDEVASYGERIKKWVVSLLLGTRPASLCSARPSVGFFFRSARLPCFWIQAGSVLRRGCQCDPLPTLRDKQTGCFYVRHISPHPAWPLNWINILD